MRIVIILKWIGEYEMKEFEINDEWQILTAERDRIIFFNNYTKQLHVITPHTVTGDVVNVYDNITCLSFDLDERLNLKLWREMCSSIYVKDEDRELTHGEVFDLLNSQCAIIADLEKQNNELKKGLNCTKKAKEELRKQKEENAIRWANIGR